MSNDELAVFRRKNYGFFFHKMNLMDNVIAASNLTSWNKADITKRANMLFDMVNIPPATRKKLPPLISGGETQRAGIVQAAINEPSDIFAKVPTGAFNSNNSDAVLDVFSMLNGLGQSIIVVNHDKKSALRGNRVAYLKNGAIQGDCDLGAYAVEDTTRTRKLENFLKEMG